MDAWGVARRDLLWELGALPENEGELDLVFAAEPVGLPSQTRAEAANMEFAVTGLSTGSPPMAFYRNHLAKRGVLNSKQLGSHPPRWKGVGSGIGGRASGTTDREGAPFYYVGR